jgi:hypothetical protein
MTTFEIIVAFILAYLGYALFGLVVTLLVMTITELKHAWQVGLIMLLWPIFLIGYPILFALKCLK